MSLRLTLLRAPLRSASPLRSSFAAPISVRRISQYQRLYSSTPDEKDKDGADGAKKKRPPPPPRAPLEPTTFDGKASPRDVHNRPVRLRGMPPTMAAWEVERSHSRPRSNAAGPRPAPRPKLEEHIFNESAAPRAIYKRPTRELPLANSRIGLWITLGLVGLSAWGLFILYATNNERYSSSVVRQVAFQLRNSPDVAALLGDHVTFARNFWGFGEPWIAGNINLMQGRIDVKFRMKGDKQEGTVYFTSIRPTQGAPWRIVRYKVIGEYGDVIRLEDKVVRPVIDDDAAAATGDATPGDAVESVQAAAAEALPSSSSSPSTSTSTSPSSSSPPPAFPASSATDAETSPAPIAAMPTKAALWKPEVRIV